MKKNKDRERESGDVGKKGSRGGERGGVREEGVEVRKGLHCGSKQPDIGILILYFSQARK